VQGIVEVATLEQVFGQPVEQLLGVATEGLLRTVPSFVAGYCGHGYMD
jgi:hypothetical protein